MLSVTDTQRKRLAAVLALLWGLYALMGASGACRPAGAQTVGDCRPASRAPAQAPGSRCPMCSRMKGGMMPGGMRCCCKPNLPTTSRAILCSCGDRGAPTAPTAIAAMSWPVTVPASPMTALVPPDGTLSYRRRHRSAPSAFLPPPTPPPCLL